MDRIKRLIKWQTSLIIAVVFVISAIIYFVAIRNLIKPASLQEAIQFLFEYPGEYFIALFFGAIAKATMLLMIVITVGVTFRFLMGSFDEYTKEFSLGYLIISWIATIIISGVQKYIVAYFWTLLGVLVIIVFLVYLFISADN